MPDVRHIRGDSSPPGDASRPERDVDRRIAELAGHQYGAVSHVQLLALGLTTDQIKYRIKVGRLIVLYRGVYAVGHLSLSRQGRCSAAILACGEGAVLSHRSAGAHWGIAPYSGPMIDVTAPNHRRSRKQLVVRRCRLHPADATVHERIPVTTVARTLLDLAEIVDLRRLERTLERAEKLDLFDLRAIEATLSRAHGRRGLKNLRQALALYLPDDRTRSDFERDFLTFYSENDLAPPRVNALIQAGLNNYEVDAFWPEATLIIELDSWEHHRDRASFERDRARDAALRLAGYEVIRLTWRRLTSDPQSVANLIRDLLSRRASR